MGNFALALRLAAIPFHSYFITIFAWLQAIWLRDVHRVIETRESPSNKYKELHIATNLIVSGSRDET